MDASSNTAATSSEPPESSRAVDSGARAAIALSLVPGVGPRIQKQLLRHFGDAEAVLAAAPSELRQVSGVGAKLATTIAATNAGAQVDELLGQCQAASVAVLTPQTELYPRPLRDIPDPPTTLFVRGQLEPADAVAVAIVGTRHATSYGRTQAERLAAGLARAGVTVVSGLARGIDAAAHRGALAAGGRTLAVLGSGVCHMYPPEHKTLAEEVIAQGALLSETSPHSPPLGSSFPQRNRIITGLSLGVIVVEAAERSGALISARHAMEQGREVFAVPGPVSSRVSRGCHKLIRDGAALVQSVDDVLEELGPLVEAAPTSDGREIRSPAELQLNELERAVLDCVATTPTGIDDIVANSNLPTPRVLAIVSVLELRRLVRRVSGNTLIRL